MDNSGVNKRKQPSRNNKSGKMMKIMLSPEDFIRNNIGEENLFDMFENDYQSHICYFKRNPDGTNKIKPWTTGYTKDISNLYNRFTTKATLYCLSNEFIKKNTQCDVEEIKGAQNDLNALIDRFSGVSLDEKISMLKQVSGGGQKGGMIGVQPLALMMLIVNDFAVETVEKATNIMNTVLDMSVRIVDIISNNEGCLQDYLNMVLGNTLTQLFQGVLFIQILMRAPDILPDLFVQLINLIGTISPYLLGSGSFLAQGIIGSIALTMVNYYINIAGEGLKKTNDTVTDAANNIKDIVEMPAEQVIENTAQAIKATKEAIEYIRDNQEKMKTDIENEQENTQQKITTGLRLGIIDTLMKKLDNEKADLQRQIDNENKNGISDQTLIDKFNNLAEQYGHLIDERDSLKDKLNNEKEEAANKMDEEEEAAAAAVAEGPGDNIGGGTRKKRTSRKGKKKASKNRKTKARRGRKSRKTKK